MSHRRPRPFATVLVGACALALMIPLGGAPTGSAAAAEVAAVTSTGPTAVEMASVASVAPTLAKPKKKAKPIRIHAVSNRPDLVSGGDVRVVVRKVKGLKRRQVKVRLNGDDVTQEFQVRPGGLYEAYLTGLDVGRNVIKATGKRKNAGTKVGGKERGGPGSKLRFAGKLVVTNHPNGGPIFSGPQHGPYVCQESAVDEQCNEPPSYSFLYKSSDPTQAELQPYDPDDPPSRRRAEILRLAASAELSTSSAAAPPRPSPPPRNYPRRRPRRDPVTSAE